MEWVKLGDVAEISSGGTPRRSNVDYWKNGDIPWIKISDMKSKYVSETEEFITESGLKNSSAKLFKQGTIIYTIFATIGEIAILDIDATTNQAIAGITLIDNRINKEYIYYYLLSMKEQMKGIARGVAQKNLNLSILKDVSIPLLDIQKQKELVSYFKINESLISTRKAQIVALDELVQSLFYEMFGDVDDSKFATDIFENLTIVNQGLQIAQSKRYKEYVDNSYEYITIQYLNGKKDREYVVPKSENVICNKEDILVTRTGNTGQIVTGVEGVFHNNFFKVNYNKALLLKEYLYYFLNLKTTQSRIKLLAGTSTIPDLNHGDFYSIEIPLPPLELQEQFAAKVEAIETQKAKLQASLQEMETLFNALMQEAFSGNLG